jgi:hypothetical protein
VLKCFIGWHVYGLMHRADKNYEESAKCYANALKFNKNDVNILRDFVVLQTQLRQYDSLVVSHIFRMCSKFTLFIIRTPEPSSLKLDLKLHLTGLV